MRRPHHLLIANVAIGLTLAACAASGASQGPGASSGGAPSIGGAPSTARAQSQGGGGGGNGGLALPDGAWSSGQVHVVASGGGDATVDADLVPANSYTTSGTTVFTYIDQSAGSAVGVAIYADSFAISVTTSTMVGGAGTTSNSPCEVTYNRSDDNAVDATFRCPNAPVVFGTGAGGTADLEGSFTANR